MWILNAFFYSLRWEGDAQVVGVALDGQLCPGLRVQGSLWLGFGFRMPFDQDEIS